MVAHLCTSVISAAMCYHQWKSRVEIIGKYLSLPLYVTCSFSQRPAMQVMFLLPLPYHHCSVTTTNYNWQRFLHASNRNLPNFCHNFALERWSLFYILVLVLSMVVFNPGVQLKALKNSSMMASKAHWYQLFLLK